jgi:hypothetical protein
MSDGDFTEVPELLRARLADLVGGALEQIVLGNSNSYGQHVVANGLPWRPGDEVLVIPGGLPGDDLAVAAAGAPRCAGAGAAPRRRPAVGGGVGCNDRAAYLGVGGDLGGFLHRPRLDLRALGQVGRAAAPEVLLRPAPRGWMTDWSASGRVVCPARPTATAPRRPSLSGRRERCYRRSSAS